MDQHHHHPPKKPSAPGASVPAGLFDNTRSVKLNIGGDGNEGKGTMVDAYVLHEIDAKNFVLGRFINGTFQLVNDGNPITERAPKDYGPEGGGLTWTD